jgi:hypothetical protein
MIIPDDNLIFVILEHEHYYISFVHHFDQCDGALLYQLRLLLQLHRGRVILHDLEPDVGRHREVFLCLIAGYMIYRLVALRQVKLDLDVSAFHQALFGLPGLPEVIICRARF